MSHLSSMRKLVEHSPEDFPFHGIVWHRSSLRPISLGGMSRLLARMLGSPPPRIAKRPVRGKHFAIELVGEVHRLSSVVGEPLHLAVRGGKSALIRPWSGKSEVSVCFNRPMDRLYLT